MSNKSINSVFYANSYHPIQAGSIDGTDILPHDNAVLRAHLCSSAALYDPYGDPNATGDPYCTLFVSRLSHLSTEHTLRRAMNKYGRVKNLRLVRHIVTGASCGYAFVEFETQREMRRAYKDAHHSIIDDSEVLVDYNRQQLMPGWIPRRLGGGLGGKKESGQLRFGGRERPFRAPLRPIPYDDLKKLGIPPPPEGKYMSRHQVPSPPRRDKSSEDREGDFNKSRSMERYESSPVGEDDHRRKMRSMDREERGDHYNERTSVEKDGRSYSSTSRSEQYHKRKLVNDDVSHKDGGRHSQKHSHKRRKSHRSDSRSSESEDWR